jgi:cobalt-zinc-cadmium efflux system membrane fusion protein
MTMDDDDDVIDQRATRDRRGRVRRYVGVTAGAVALLFVGAAGGVLWSERHGGARTRLVAPNRDAQTPAASPDGRSMPGMSGMPAPPGQAAAAKTDDAVEVSLTPEAVERAGIKIAAAKAQSSVSGVTVPGSVMSNAYRDTKVNALVGGIVRQVMVELGAEVRRGVPLAVIFSSELADAQMKYLSMRAMLEADHQKLQRTQQLVTLGAASRQELEEATAVHSGHETEVAAARQRLLLFGLSSERVTRLETASQVASEVTVTSPADGVVIARSVNPGQVINAGQDLFVVTDLSTVWIIGDLYERDFSRVRVGSAATVMLPSMPDRTLKGRVAYIDPRVDAATRTAKVRVEVPNRGGDLRLGMFVTMSIETGTTEQITVVPRAAVQTIGDRSVVYVPAEGEEGKFVERAVKLGTPAGEFVPVLSGLKPGDKVVTDGSFYLRAEAARRRSGG